MKQTQRIKLLVRLLNFYRDKYYNESFSAVSDAEYDKMFDELVTLEKETGIVMNGSPTQTVGYEVKSKLKKVEHNHPMLSLDKTKSIDDVMKFLSGREAVAMLKMDGLTCSLKYQNGELLSAETRGNGTIGEDVLHNVKTIANVPKNIALDNLIVDGEVIITRQDFDDINSKLIDDDKYRNPRNLASGSIRQLDSEVAAQRKMKFITWKLVSGTDNNSFHERLSKLSELGFEVVPFRKIRNNATSEEVENAVCSLREYANDNGLPIDGIVFSYDDIAYGESLGMTGHHPRYSYAMKFNDDEVSTILRDIEWSMGKSVITPVAIFDTVEIDGTEVGRASLHNISICKDLKLGIGDEITVYKANAIIPQIKNNITKSNTFIVPDKCPVCGSQTEIVKDNNTEVLICTNPDCKGKRLMRLSHFASRDAMNIEGLSEATIEKIMSVIDIENFSDIYTLKDHYDKLVGLEGMGVKSVKKLFDEVEESKDTDLAKFLYSMSIPLIGKTASKTISKYFHGSFEEMYSVWINGFDWTVLDDFGKSMDESMWNYISHNMIKVRQLADLMTFKVDGNTGVGAPLGNNTYCITGTLNKISRKELTEKLESLGAKVAGSVSKNTTCLVNNDVTSGSSKNIKAKQLGVPIMNEEEFLSTIKEHL